jgi:phosphate-selective porin OprO and OprP
MGTAQKGILMRFVVLSGCLLMLLPRSAAAQADFRFPPPSIRAGEFRADFGVRLHLDFRGLDSDQEVAPEQFLFRRARLAIEGRIYDDLEYELDADARDSNTPWRDVFLNYRRFRAAEIQAGKFKVPFGLDQLTSAFANSFVARSLIGNQLAPGRDRGVMAHGRVAGDRVAYRGGWFKQDGDNTLFTEELEENEFAEARPVNDTLAGRVELTPWAGSKGPGRHLQLGVNATSGSLDGGLFGMRGRTVHGFTFFDPVYVSGRRMRSGIDGRWTPGPFSVVAEYNRVTDQRNGQGLGDVDLPDVIAHGWYLAGTWALTGENKAGGIDQPGRPLFQGGAGGVEVVARFEELRFSSAGTGGEEPFTNPRAPNILPNRDRAITLGANWYLNRFGRVLFNAVRETIQDPARSPLLDRTGFWTGIVRLQFVM